MVQMLVSFDSIIEKGIFNEECNKFLERYEGTVLYVEYKTRIETLKEQVMKIPYGQKILVDEERGDLVSWEVYKRFVENKDNRFIEIYWYDCDELCKDNMIYLMHEEVNGRLGISIEELYDLRDLAESSERKVYVSDNVIWCITFEGFVMYIGLEALDDMIARYEDVMDAQ